MNALQKLKNNQTQDIFLFKYFIFGKKTYLCPCKIKIMYYV